MLLDSNIYFFNSYSFSFLLNLKNKLNIHIEHSYFSKLLISMEFNGMTMVG